MYIDQIGFVHRVASRRKDNTTRSITWKKETRKASFEGELTCQKKGKVKKNNPHSTRRFYPSSTSLDTQVLAEVGQDVDDGNVDLDALLDRYEDMRASPDAALNEFDMDVSDLGDGDANLLRRVLAKPVANGHNDLDDDLYADIDNDSHGAAVNPDLLNESDGDLDFLDDLGNNWTPIIVAI